MAELTPEERAQKVLTEGMHSVRACAQAIHEAVGAETERCAQFIETHTTDWGDANKIVKSITPSASHKTLAAALRTGDTDNG